MAQLHVSALETLHILIQRLQNTLESTYTDATVSGGFDAAYKVFADSEESKTPTTDIRSYRYPKSHATSEFSPTLKLAVNFTSSGPLNGKGRLSLGGASYAMYRTASMFLSHGDLSGVAVEICNGCFRLMREPFELEMSKLSSARLSSALLSLACTVRRDLEFNEVTNEVVEASEIKTELILGLKHLTELEPTKCKSDPYETNSTNLNAMISKLDIIPTFSTLLNPCITIPNIFVSAVKTCVHTSQSFRVNNTSLAKSLTPLAYGFDERGTRRYERVYEGLEECVEGIEVCFNGGGGEVEMLERMRRLLTSTDATNSLEMGCYDELVVKHFVELVKNTPDAATPAANLVLEGLQLGRVGILKNLDASILNSDDDSSADDSHDSKILDYILLNPSGSPLLNTILLHGETIHEATFSSFINSVANYVSDNVYKMKGLEVNKAVFQGLALRGFFGLEVSNVVDSNLTPSDETFTNLRGLFCKQSKSVRERCCDFFASEGNTRFLQNLDSNLEALEIGTSNEEKNYKVEDEVGIELKDYNDLCKLLLSKNEDLDVKAKAANVLAVFIRDDTTSFKTCSNPQPEIISNIFHEVVCKNLETFARLFKQIVINENGIRMGLINDHSKVKSITEHLSSSPINNERTETNRLAILNILNGLHRVAFDVSHYVPSAPPNLPHLLPTVCRTFYYDSTLYEINDFVIKPENDLVVNRVFKGLTTRQSLSLGERLNAVIEKIQMAEDGKAMKESVVECHKFLNCWVGWEQSLEDGKILKALHRVLSVPPSSTRDHELLSTTLRLVNTLLPHISTSTFTSLVNSLTRIAQPVLDKNTVSPSMAEDGVDVSGLSIKNRYSDLTFKELKRRERRGKRAIRALWKCRTEMIKFLFNAITDDKCAEEMLVYIVRDTEIVERLTEGYLECYGENENIENFNLTSRAQSSAISLLHVLLDNDGMPYEQTITAYFAEPPKDNTQNSTHFETWIPKLIKLASNSARMPDSFQFKGPSRSAALMLKTVSSFITSTKTTTSLLSTASSYRQLKEKAAWTLEIHNIDWCFKLLCDREAVVRSVGYGICGDLLNLAWAQSLVMTSRQDQDIEDELAGGEPKKFIRFSTSILEMACRASADDSESPIVRSECFSLLRNAICVGGAALENNTSEVMDVIPSIGRMLSRASARMGQQKNKDEDTTTRGTDDEELEEER
ncbi:hypothetical protein TL16_g08806 [Triparma laevis f. inornata]|uniref:Uncharacterized protein n=1 Tax=Triparma laevis f. inornata TaxID=1714386 RepID=A0A9W7AY57_9STRA|nr:hypothetical protein TL16_g08806 [Triparma laevis f. inornata]